MARMTYPLDRAIQDFGQLNDCRLVRKDTDRLSRAIGFFWPAFLSAWWTTYRLPWWERPKILYPTTVRSPFQHPVALAHEKAHLPQTRGCWRLLWSGLLCFVLPLPVLCSGRWFLERGPYLVDIRNGARIPDVVDKLWRRYWWPWPARSMRLWFERQVRGPASGS